MENLIMIICIAGLSFQFGMLFESVRSTRKYLEEQQ